MERRLFLRLLSLPFVTPIARKIQISVSRLRHPTWWVRFDVRNTDPFEVDVLTDKMSVRRIAFPSKSGPCSIPMYGPPPHKIRVSFSTAGAPFKLYSYNIDWLYDADNDGVGEDREVS
jgi:hypothetical protein